MTAPKNYTKELTALYKQTYGEASQYLSSLNNIATLTADDGIKYVIGVHREKNEQYTDSGDYEPHMRSLGIIFAAALDKQGNLTGNSIRIKGESEEACHFSEKYKRRKINRPNDELLKQCKSITCIDIDINQGDDLPRTVLCTDNSIQGRPYSDYSTMVDGYYNVIDRSEFLQAAYSKHHGKLYQDPLKNQKIAEICTQFLVPDASDRKCHKEEAERLKQKQKQEELNYRLEKRQALRKFIERENTKRSKGLKIFGYGTIQNSARKALAKRMLPKLITLVQTEKQQKTEQDLEIRRQWQETQDCVLTIIENR